MVSQTSYDIFVVLYEWELFIFWICQILISIGVVWYLYILQLSMLDDLNMISDFGYLSSSFLYYSRSYWGAVHEIKYGDNLLYTWSRPTSIFWRKYTFWEPLNTVKQFSQSRKVCVSWSRPEVPNLWHT